MADRGGIVSSSGLDAVSVRAVHDLPLDVSEEKTLSVVEHLLLDLAFESVGVQYRRRTAGGVERIEYLGVPGTGGELFERHRYVLRQGWLGETVSRATVREDLVELCHRDVDAELVVRSRETLESVQRGVALRAWQPGSDHDGDGGAGVAGV